MIHKNLIISEHQLIEIISQKAEMGDIQAAKLFLDIRSKAREQEEKDSTPDKMIIFARRLVTIKTLVNQQDPSIDLD